MHPSSQQRPAAACADCGRVSLFSWWWTDRGGQLAQVCFDCLTQRGEVVPTP